jgi:uncharacterized lipoprotein YmbA
MKWLCAVVALALMSCGGEKSEEEVYVTRYGKRYHQEWCKTIKGRWSKTVPKSEAESMGRTPCGVCY